MHASCVRAIVMMVWCLVLVSTPYEQVAVFADMSDGFGVGRLVLSVPMLKQTLFCEDVLRWLRIVTVVTALAGLCSRKVAAWALPLMFAAVVSLDSVSKSVGAFANHAQVVPLLVLGCFAVRGQALWLTVPEIVRVCLGRPIRAERSRAAYCSSAGVIASVSFVVALPYCYVGLERLCGLGVSLLTDDILLDYLSAASRGFDAYPQWFDARRLGVPLRVGFVLTTAFEICSIALLMSRWFRSVWLAWMAVFHISTLYLMNIVFWENLIIAIAVFLPVWRNRPMFGAGRGSRT